MDQFKSDHFAVTETIAQAADSLSNDSFAIYRVDNETAEAIRAAWQDARHFFASPDTSSFHRVVLGHLHGFHVPSDAKHLYRAFCDSSLQPWPNEQFRKSSQHVAQKLHTLLIDCYKALIRQSCDNHDELEDATTPSKRLKLTLPQQPSVDEVDSAHEDAHYGGCPLDYFLYHGDKPSAVSCSEHVDRGVLICVCLTNVAGLEVRPREATSFVCPEVDVHNTNLYVERQACPGLVCIMAGDELKKTHPQVAACVHRVRNDLKQSRLSISYELRAPQPIRCLDRHTPSA